MSTTIIGFPRLGEFRELKFTTEKYFRNEISADELLAAAKDLRAKHWNIVKEKGITEIPSNDFSHYDNVLDAAFLFNVVPASVQNLELTDLERYFALARGYQGEKGDVRALVFILNENVTNFNRKWSTHDIMVTAILSIVLARASMTSQSGAATATL